MNDSKYCHCPELQNLRELRNRVKQAEKIYSQMRSESLLETPEELDESDISFLRLLEKNRRKCNSFDEEYFDCVSENLEKERVILLLEQKEYRFNDFDEIHEDASSLEVRCSSCRGFIDEIHLQCSEEGS